MQGTEIAPNIRKIRMPITAKGRGKSGGARVITYNAIVAEQEGKIYLLLIYDKADASNIKMNVVKEIIKAHGENINVISTEGIGTEFIFTLEKAR